jgi:hypothetical protein
MPEVSREEKTMLRKYSPEPSPEMEQPEKMHPSGIPAAHFLKDEVRIHDPLLCHAYIRQRQQCGIDDRDEVWDGVYVVPPLANNPHQALVLDFCVVLRHVVRMPDKGQVLPGANVSDRREDWHHNFRAPDVVVVLKDGKAEDCGTHWLGGPDFLVEIESPGDDTEEKTPFYGQLVVRELLIVHRDTRELRLLRHDGQALVEVGRSSADNRQWLQSEVVPLAFRWKMTKAGPRTEIKRTDGKRKTWTV